MKGGTFCESPSQLLNVINRLAITCQKMPVPQRSRALITNIKAVISGNMVELWEYEKPTVRWLEKSSPSQRGTSDRTGEEWEEKTKKNALESYYNFLRLAVINFGKRGTKFLTLTFANTTAFDVCSVGDCNAQFELFIKRLRKIYGKEFKYLATIEFQDTTDRGAVHYHLLIDLPYIKQETWHQIWGLGFVTIRAVKDAKHSAVYCGKYMRKGLIDARLMDRKKFWGSRNLDRPREIYNEKALALLESFPHKEKYCESSYLSQYHDGEIRYSKFFIHDSEEVAATSERLNSILASE